MSLVSIIISTYNSSKYILNTLVSITSQSYADIELIISDDASKDETLKIIKNWLSQSGNLNRFKNVRILESIENTGVSANANRGLKVASGNWIKFLGADDALLSDCISDNMQYIKRNSDIKVLFSKINVYRNTFEEYNFIKVTPTEVKEESILWPGRNSLSQYKMLLLADRVHFSPSVFINREALLSVGGFDERFRLMEDYPLWLNFTRNGHKLYFMNKVTVNYRQHSKAINNTGEPLLINPNYYRSESFRRLFTYPFLPPVIRADQKFRWVVSQVFRIDLFNRPTRFNRNLLNFLTIYLNPFKYMIKVKKILTRNLVDVEFYG